MAHETVILSDGRVIVNKIVGWRSGGGITTADDNGVNHDLDGEHGSLNEFPSKPLVNRMDHRSKPWETPE